MCEMARRYLDTLFRYKNGYYESVHQWYSASLPLPLSPTTTKTKISEGYLVRENVKSLSNSVTKFCDQGICEEFHFFRH